MGEYFDMDYPSPFMLLVFDVKAEKRSAIPAVTHVDKSGRVQTVNQEENGVFYDLIAAFDRKTGIPVILNTSFNVQGMPIVNSPDDAMECFFLTDLDFLVMGQYLIGKEDS